MTSEGLLDAEIARRTRQGWGLVSRQGTTAQMVRRKHFSFPWAVFWLIFGIGIGFVCYLLWHWAKRDRFAYLRVEDGSLVVSEQRGLLGTLWASVVSYWGWAGRRTTGWGKALAYGGPVAAVVVLIIVIAAAGSGGGGGTKEEEIGQGSHPAATTKPHAPASTPIPVAKNKVAAVAGASGEAHDVRVTLNQIADPWQSEFLPPDAGKRYVAFDVTVENIGKSGTHDANLFNFKLTDAQAFAYEATFIGPDPSLGYVGLGSGEKTRGWVSFEVNQGAGLDVLKYDPDIFSKDDIEFQFR